MNNVHQQSCRFHRRALSQRTNTNRQSVVRKHQACETPNELCFSPPGASPNTGIDRRKTSKSTFSCWQNGKQKSSSKCKFQHARFWQVLGWLETTQVLVPRTTTLYEEASRTSMVDERNKLNFRKLSRNNISAIDVIRAKRKDEFFRLVMVRGDVTLLVKTTKMIGKNSLETSPLPGSGTLCSTRDRFHGFGFFQFRTFSSMMRMFLAQNDVKSGLLRLVVYWWLCFHGVVR